RVLLTAGAGVEMGTRIDRRAAVVAAACALVGCGAQGESTGSLRGAESVASGAPGVVFIHGTGTHTPESAVADYWTQPSIDAMSAGYPYLVVGYRGEANAGFDEGAWGDIASQIDAWMSSSGIGRLVVITHSNGDNPVRYLVHHSNANDAVARIVAATSQVVFLAPDGTGTPLADKVTVAGTTASLANGIADTFGFGNYNSPAVWQQRTDSMATYNSDGTFDDQYGDQGGTRIAGAVPVITIGGTTVDAAVWSSAPYCGGYSTTVGLKATLIYGWGYDGCADGFIGCDSSQYVGYAGDVGFADPELNHNQSRRGCDGVGDRVAAIVSAALQ
ncbi:MAG: hypothetical protein ACHREM_33775, partial [Polyangiales bacterium]